MIETSARLLRLLTLFQARRFWAGADLADRLGVSERTVRRDVDRLRSLGYPVDSSAGVAGGYQLGAGAKLPPLLLEDDEAMAVSLGLSTAATGSVSGVEEAAVRALAKLERMLPKRLRTQVKNMQSAVVPLYFARPQVDAALLTSLAGACADQERAAFAYADHHGQSSERDVEPHGLVHTGARWYLVAWDVDRDDWRTFRVDRIKTAPVRGARFSKRKVPGRDLAAFVSKSVSTRAYAIRARVVFHAPLETIAAQVPPLVAHLKRKGKDRCVLESGAHSIRMLAVQLAMLEQEFEVEHPPELAEYVKALGRRFTRAAKRSTTSKRSSAKRR